MNYYRYNQDEEGIDISQIRGRDAISAFSSTPRFIKDLTELSVDIIAAQDKEAALKGGLAKLNEFLPATVYLPFVTAALRNYTVLRVVPEESRLFLTKERAPFLVCLEVYRPEEFILAEEER